MGFEGGSALQGGLNAWFRADLPGDGPEEWVFDARTPSEATAAPAVRQFSNQGRVADKSRDSVYTVRLWFDSASPRPASSKGSYRAGELGPTDASTSSGAPAVLWSAISRRGERPLS